MIEKIKKYLKNDIKRNYKFYICLFLILLLFVIKLDYYIYSPGSLVDLTNRINVENSYESKGNFNLTYVTARPGSIINVMLSYIIPSWDLESIDSMRIENESTKEIEARDKLYLKETSYDAIIAAFSEANIDYEIESLDVTITYVMENANTDLKVNDVIKSINGNTISNYEDITNEISKYNKNDIINIEVLRNNKIVKCYSKLIDNNGKVLIGVTLAELKKIKTNPKVEYIFKNNESGSSRGLMCALDIYNKITEFDLTKGRKISGTGSIDEKGRVGKIDGVKYKLLGAYKKHAQIFIVPSDNYEEAMKIKNENKLEIEIIEADNLHNVIEKLK